MFENIMKFLRKGIKKEEQKTNSKSAAKERLHLVLMQDRANVSADFLELMKQEIIEVIKKYICVEEQDIDVRMKNKIEEDGSQGAPFLYANIPVLNVKNEAKKEALIEATAKKEDAKVEVDKSEEEKVEADKSEEGKLEERAEENAKTEEPVTKEEKKEAEVDDKIKEKEDEVKPKEEKVKPEKKPSKEKKAEPEKKSTSKKSTGKSKK